MRDLNYRHLGYFHAVAHDGNLTRTAERLHLSQSALSVQIRKLEERLGQSLFERRGRQLHLTEPGRIVLDHADAIFSAGEELLGALESAGRSRLALRVGALATLSRNFQMSFLAPVLGRDDVELVLRSGTTAELLHGLETLNLDVVLVQQPPQRDAVTPFVAHRLAEQRISLIGTPELLADSKANLAELLSLQPVVLPTLESSVRTDFDALCARMGLRPRIAAEVDDMAMMRLLAREGIGLAVLPPIVVKDELANGTLIERDHLPDIVERFFAVTTQRRFPNPLVGLLLGGSDS